MNSPSHKRLNDRWIRKPTSRYKQLIRVAGYRKLDVTITLDEFTQLIEQSCFYCKGSLPATGSGLDRLDNKMGYVHGNIVPCCKRCNFVKGCLENAGFRYPRTEELLRELLKTNLEN